MFKLFVFICLVSVLNIYTTSLRRTLYTTNRKHGIRNYNFRVHKGRDLRAGEYPYVITIIAIFKQEKMFFRTCTGSMISETWVITAAHCLFSMYELVIQYDNFTISPFDSGCYVPIIDKFWHPGFRPYAGVDFGDIGLVRTKGVPRKPFAVLLAADYATLMGLPVVYVGGGMTNWTDNSDVDTGPLQVGEAIIIPCDEEMKNISRFLICLASKCSNRLENSMDGDSGGPLIYDGKVIGVCSGGPDNKIVAKTGYSPVSKFIDWIYHVMNDPRA